MKKLFIACLLVFVITGVFGATTAYANLQQRARELCYCGDPCRDCCEPVVCYEPVRCKPVCCEPVCCVPCCCMPCCPPYICGFPDPCESEAGMFIRDRSSRQ